VTETQYNAIAGLLQLIGALLLLVASAMGYGVLTSPRLNDVRYLHGLPPPIAILPIAGGCAIVGLGLVGRLKWGALLLATCSLAMAGWGVAGSITSPATRPAGAELAIVIAWVALLLLPVPLAWLGWRGLKWR
jgi:hypothetical protein